jgi:hypothetical protein
MDITSSYIGYKKNRDARYAFFLLTENYIQENAKLVKQLNPLLSEFARALGHDMALVAPFDRDVQAVHQSVLAKDWPEGDLQRIVRTPGLLVIDVDFKDFNPKAHQWLHISFRDGMNEYGDVRIFEVKELLEGLVSLTASDISLSKLRDDIESEIRADILKKGFGAKIGAFGLSFDLSAGVKYLKRFLAKR